MSNLAEKAARELFKPGFGHAADVDMRIAFKVLMLYLVEKGVIDGDEYSAYINDVLKESDEIIERGDHGLPINGSTQKGKYELKSWMRTMLQSFTSHATAK